jgi:type II pantothenate kinase
VLEIPGQSAATQLRQLADAARYRACDWDLKRNADARRAYLAHFRRHLERLTALIAEQEPQPSRAGLEAFRREHLRELAALENEPQRGARLDILTMDETLADLLERYGFDDPYRTIKARETAAALETLPRRLAELDAHPPELQLERLACGLLAGNLFDLGAPASVSRFGGRWGDFRQMLASVPPRPWFIDGLDAWRSRLLDGPTYGHLAFFVDNAGPDICLGCLPLARWMVRTGTRVTLVANSGPALNDVTAPELNTLLERVATLDPPLAEARAGGRLAVCGSGSRTALIDLTRLDAACVAALGDADLILLHGMGRSLESNYRAKFHCDTLRVAVVKQQAVAELVGARLFDCVFRYEGGPESEGPPHRGGA